MAEVRIFDRVRDVSKLVGCNTRNVEYRWAIFCDNLSSVPVGSNVLDFGAGSLRDSYELAVRGYNVTSFDMDEKLLSSYSADYEWPSNGIKRKLVSGAGPADCLAKLAGEQFSLITSFDVLEHLEDPVPVMKILRSLLLPDGKMFITVPNGRSLFELALRLDLMIARATKRRLRPGEPHLQCNSPGKWARLIEQAGFKIVAHDMQIGALVNTTFALVQLPTLLCCRFLRRLGMNCNGVEIASGICNDKRMSALERLDQISKPMLKGLYGWNLFVVSRSDSQNTAPF